MNRPLKLSLAVALALGTSQAFALGLGTIVVKSKLNEPLVAEIPINEGAIDESATVNAALASAEDMKKVGVDTSQLAVPLDFTVIESGGRRAIRVTSRDAVRDPLLSFLIEVNWSKGKMLREYNVLLDPQVVAPAVVGTRAVTAPVREPERAAPKPVPPPKPSAAAPTAAAPATKPEASTSAATEPTPSPAAPTPPPAPSGAAGEYGPVATGETLWEIATRTRPERTIGVNQMMVSLLRANPSAFYRDNVNTLKRGAVLRIPSAEEVRALTPGEAAAAIAAQNSEFGNRVEPVKVADSGRTPAAPPTTASTTPPPSTPSHLELVPPKAGAGKSGADKPGTTGGTDAGSAAVKADLARTKEQLSAREQEAGELKSRVKDLEKLKSDNERLITLKNSQIAELQQKLAELNRQIDTQKRDLAKAQTAPATPATAATPPPSTTTPLPPPKLAPTTTPATSTTAPSTTSPTTAATTTPTTEPPKVEPSKVEPPKVEPLKPDTTTSTAPTAPVEPSTDSGAKITPLPETKPATPVPMPEAATEPPPSGPAWYTNPLVFGAAGLALILGGVALLFGRRKKSEAVLDSEEVHAPSMGDEFRASPGSAAALAAEARESDEERALLERLAADPTDTDVHLDLLRLYYMRQDSDKFEAAANAMYAQLPDPSVPAWHRVAEMGRELLPDDPLFTEPPPSAEVRHEHPSTMTPPSPAEVAAAADAARTEYEFDFDLNRNEPAAASATAAGLAASAASRAAEVERMPESEPAFDFDLAEPASSTHDPHPEPPMDEPTFVVESVPEFDFDTEIERPSLDKIPTQEFKAPDVRPAGDGVFGDDDAVGTKLDLARAYLDMGDPDGARSMLQEVLAEGNTTQKDEARKLLSEIG